MSMSPHQNNQRVVLRNPSRWIAFGLYLILAAVGAYCALVATSIFVCILYAVVSAALFVLAIRAARSGLWVGEGGVTAKADRFTRHLPWGEIEGFELGLKHLKLASGSGLGARRRDGKRVHLMDYGIDPNRRYQAAVDDLETELAQRQQPRIPD